MIVRVFVPRSHVAQNGTFFSGSDHNFPVIPNIGHVLRFTDERNGAEFTVAKSGFFQQGDAFIAAM